MTTLPSTPSQEVMDYVERLLGATRPERITYLALTGLSVVILLVSACVLIVRTHAEVGTLVSLFGSTGVVTYSSGQILRIWTDAFRLVAPKGNS
jgi:hypothetical protein